MKKKEERVAFEPKVRTMLLGGVVLASLCCQASSQVVRTEVLYCEELKGISGFNDRGVFATPNHFKGLHPLVVVEDKQIKVTWRAPRPARDLERVWNAAVLHRSSDSASGVGLEESEGGAMTMLYTVDLKHRYFYYSYHQESRALGTFAAASFVSKCK